MNYFKNIHLLTDIPEKDLEKIEHAAFMHRRHANIQFKILTYTSQKVVFRISQGKSAAGNYQDKKRLKEIVKETFGRFFSDKKIQVEAEPFKDSPANQVDQEWIKNKMDESGVRLKEMALDTGIDYTQLSALVTGNRPLSQPMKALFWYYFATQEKKTSSTN